MPSLWISHRLDLSQMLGKTELLRTLAVQNRGLLTQESDRQAILAAITRLEELNPTPHPLTALGKLEGDWQLLYTTSQGLLGLDRLPLCQLGQIYQCIRTAQQAIYNIAEVILPLGSGLVAVSARFEAVSDKRASVAFQRSIFGFQNFLSYRGPQSFIEKLNANPKLPILQGVDFAIRSDRQQGWLEITYLDDDLRVGRGNAGSLFVLQKV